MDQGISNKLNTVLYYYFWNIIKHTRQTTLRSIHHTFILVFSVKPEVNLDVFPCHLYRNWWATVSVHAGNKFCEYVFIEVMSFLIWFIWVFFVCIFMCNFTLYHVWRLTLNESTDSNRKPTLTIRDILLNWLVPFAREPLLGSREPTW